jgi:hypothetical protein
MDSVFISSKFLFFCEATKSALENWGEMVYLGEGSDAYTTEGGWISVIL